MTSRWNWLWWATLGLAVAVFSACASAKDQDDGADSHGDDDAAADDDVESIFNHPHDGRLYAAAGSAVITPTDENHPCDKCLGGTALGRIATGVHDDLELRFLLLEKDGEYYVLVAGDLVGLRLPDAQAMTDALAPYGVNPDRFVFSSTHSHEAPDTMGIWGPYLFKTGRCQEYIDFLVETVVAKVTELAPLMAPVTAEAAVTHVNEEGAPIPSLQDDSRMPVVKNPNLTVARFADDAGATVATLVNWHNHPEVLISTLEYSADFPRWTRLQMERRFGGMCVYVSGTVGGLLNPLEIVTPLYTVEGERVVIDGEQQYINDDSETMTWSMGYAVADAAVAGLEQAEALDGPLVVETQEVDIPITNPAMMAIIWVELTPPYRNMITDRPGECGFYGCFPQTLQHLRLGKLHMVTVPGEGFSESSIGREESTYDFGAPWGVFTFPAMRGWREALPEGDMLIDIGLANNEIGYIVPVTDLHLSRHPDCYEEKYDISREAEQIIRDALTNMVSE